MNSTPYPLDLRHKRHLALALLYLALGIGLGAFGAHGLKSLLHTSDLEVYKTGVLYHLIIATVLLATVKWLNKKEFLSLLLGSILFSGSLYGLSVLKVLTIGPPIFLGILTPIGGLIMMVGLIIPSLRLFRESRQ